MYQIQRTKVIKENDNNERKIKKDEKLGSADIKEEFLLGKCIIAHELFLLKELGKTYRFVPIMSSLVFQ